MSVKKAIEGLRTIVDITEEQQKMLISLIEMRDAENKNFNIQKMDSEVRWELLRRC